MTKPMTSIVLAATLGAATLALAACDPGDQQSAEASDAGTTATVTTDPSKNSATDKATGNADASAANSNAAGNDSAMTGTTATPEPGHSGREKPAQ